MWAPSGRLPLDLELRRLPLRRSRFSGRHVLAGRPGSGRTVFFPHGRPGRHVWVMRFALELVRGDPVRPFACGLSEAQWCSLGVVALCAIARPSPSSLATAIALAGGATALIVSRRRRELLLPGHLYELDLLCSAVLADPARARRNTRLGVGVSCHEVPDGRLDWVLSSTHSAWSAVTARTIAAALWPGAEVIAGRTPGVVHVVAASANSGEWVSPAGS